MEQEDAPLLLELSCNQCGAEEAFIGPTSEDVNQQAYLAGWRMKRFRRHPVQYLCRRCLGLRKRDS